MATRWKSVLTSESVRVVVNGHAQFSAEVAATRSSKRRGLIGREFIDGALVIPGCRWVHTFGVHSPIDVAYVDRRGTIIRIDRLKPNRLGRRCSPAIAVIESYAGAMNMWGLSAGDTIRPENGGEE